MIKAILLAFWVTLSSVAAFGQIELVRSFPGYSTTIYTAEMGAKVATPGYNGSILVYNLDGSLFRAIQMPAQGGGVSLSDYPSTPISDRLFDGDDGLEALGWVMVDNHRQPAIIEENGRFQLLPMPATKRDFLSAKLFTSNGSAYALIAMDSVEAGTDSSGSVIYRGYKTYLYRLPGSLPTQVRGATGQEIVAWPVPASGRVNLRLPRTAQPGEVLEVLDMAGRPQRRLELAAGQDRQQVDATGLTPGVYTLRGAGYETHLVVE